MLKENVPIKDYTNYKIGGSARYFLEFHDEKELEQGIGEWLDLSSRQGIDSAKIFILGKGTNVLFPDSGYEGLVLVNSINSIVELADHRLEVGSGVTIEELNEYCIEHSLSGLEWSGGLPGTLGGAIFGNAGAFGGEIKDNIVSVKSIKVTPWGHFEPSNEVRGEKSHEIPDDNSKVIKRTNTECRFGYRNSIFKEELKNEEIILSAVLQFKPGNQATIEEAIESKIQYRETRQPLEFPNAGSTFKNVDLKFCSKELQELCKSEIKTDPFPVIPVAYLINEAGLAETRVGDAMISKKHPNFIINLGKANASDVKALIKLAQDKVEKDFKVKIEPEVIIL